MKHLICRETPCGERCFAAVGVFRREIRPTGAEAEAELAAEVAARVRGSRRGRGNRMG